MLDRTNTPPKKTDGDMEGQAQEARIALVFSKMARIGPFLPGSVRRSRDKRRNAKGEVKVYEGQPIFNYAVAEGRKRRKDKRIPKEAYETVKGLTENYRRFTALLRELNEAMVEAYLPDDKKNVRLRRCSSCRASRTRPRS